MTGKELVEGVYDFSRSQSRLALANAIDEEIATARRAALLEAAELCRKHAALLMDTLYPYELVSACKELAGMIEEKADEVTV